MTTADWVIARPFDSKGEAILKANRRTIGVFGANGFIGRALVKRLIRDQRQVIAFGRTFPPNYTDVVGGPVETRSIDFSDVLSVHAMMHDITDVVQLVNSSSPRLGNSRTTDDLNMNITPHISFIESCIVNKMESFIFISSGGTVYGEPQYLPIDEKHPVQPINSYGLTKLVVEQYLRMLSRNTGMRAISLRVSNPFGRGQSNKKGQGLIAAILRNHMSGLPTTILGDGSAQRDYLYIDDLIDAVLATLSAPSMQEEINIGSGIGRSILDVVSAVEQSLGKSLLLEYADNRPTDAQANILDCRKAERLLGWRAHISFQEGINRTLQSFDASSDA